MKPLERLQLETDNIQKALRQTFDHTNPDEVSGRIKELSVFLSSSAELVALAEQVYNEDLASLADQYATSKISATDKKYIFTGKLSKQIYFVTLTERQNRAITHIIEGLRSQLSLIKAEMQNIA